MTQNNMFSKIENFEQVPTSALNEIKNISDINKNTSTDDGKNIFGDSDNIFENKLNDNDFNQNQNQNYNQNQNNNFGNNLNLGKIFDSKLAVKLLDTVIPVLAVIVFSRFFKKKVDKKIIKLSADEKITIEEPLQRYLDSINFSIESPLNALILTVTLIYGSKAVEAIDTGANEQQIKDDVYNTKPFNNNEKRGRGRPRKSF